MKLDDNIKKQYKGLNKDFNPLEQPKGTYTFALNAINDSFDGNANNLVSEPSNTLCIEFNEDYYIIGSIYGENKTNYIFVTDNNGDDYIYKTDDKCNSEVLVNTNFGFNSLYPIQGEYRVRRGCDPQLYWQDNLNSDKQFNINRPNDYKTNNDWDVNKFELKPNLLPACIELLKVNDSGGRLELGNYSAQLEILDESLNIVYRTYITPEIPIYDNKITENYDLIDGGFNIDQFTPLNGGVSITNKSITFEFTNLPDEFSYARLNIIRKISGDGFTKTAVQDATLIPINNTSLQYTYTGYNPSRGDILLDYSSLIANNTEYNSSNVLTQVQNRLVRANVQSVDKDYTGFQNLANQITSEYITNEFNLKDQTNLGNSKNPNTYWESTGYMSDEVYAFAIVYIFTDGTESPAFHIPGREAISFDRDNIRTQVNLHEVSHLGITQDNLNDNSFEIERWKVYNTSGGNGNMGFYEISNNYPDTTDCNGDYIYGDLANTPIRHHKFPCRKTEPLINNENAVQLGIKFDNIQYPNGVVGHYIVRAERDEFNKTVVDNGIIGLLAGSQPDKLTYTPQHDGTRNDVNYVFYISPEVLYNKNIQGDYFVINNLYNHTSTDSNNDGTSTTWIKYHNLENTDKINYNIEKAGLLSSNFGNLNSFFNINLLRSFSISNDVAIFNLSTNLGFLEQNDYLYVTLKRNNEVYTNLNSIRYIRTHSCSKDNTFTDYYGGDSFINHLNFTDIQGSQVPNLALFGSFLPDIIIESGFNFALRSQTNDLTTSYYNTIQPINDYVNEKAYDSVNNRLTLNQEGYLYNKDFTPNGNNFYVSLPITYDYCNKCTNKNPFRIIFSPKSFDIEIGDTYRLNFTDDYIDLPAHRGEIMGLEYKNNQLIVHTTQTTFILQPNPQFVATDQSTAYLNTGDFLSIPPNELIQTDTGYGGLKNKLAKVNCKYDYIWLDETSNDIIGLKSGMLNEGLQQWLQENIEFKINKEFNDTLGIDFPYMNHIINKNGVGFQLTYDDRFDRLIIIKKDYSLANIKEFKGVVSSLNDMIEEGIYFNSTDQEWYYNGGTFIVPIDTNSRYFCNASWTLSYSFKTKNFVSYHSYHPSYSYFDENYFYTSYFNKIYKHLHKSEYLKYNEKLYPFVIEYVENKLLTNNLYSVQYITSFLRDVNNKLIELDNTNYTNLICYNSSQSTGKLNLNILDKATNPYGNISLQADNKNIVTTDFNHKIAGLYDMSTSVDNYSNNCSVILPEIYKDGYVENVPINIDYNKEQIYCGQLHDKWHKVKLFYYPTEDNVKVIHKITNTITQNSVR